MTGILISFFACGPGSEKVEKYMEDGVEIVLNGLEPYRLQNESADIFLEEELVIDLEDEKISDLGIYRLDTFAVDTAGSIYLMNRLEKNNHIHKFTNTGRFECSFGRHGQGPGELNRPTYLTVIEEDTVFVSDPGQAKLVYYRSDGTLIKETLSNANFLASPLSNGCFLVFGRIRPDTTKKVLMYPMELCDGELNPLKTLEEFEMENYGVTKRLRGSPLGFGFCFTGDRIFTGNEGRGYEIWEHNLTGKLTRKIRKKYDPVRIPEEFKQKTLESRDESLREITYFPDDFAPFHTLFADENGSLFVVTFEEGEKAGEYKIDVFNPEGVFIGRLSAAILATDNSPYSAIVQNDRMYYIRDMESGFKQFVVEGIRR